MLNSVAAYRSGASYVNYADPDLAQLAARLLRGKS